MRYRHKNNKFAYYLTNYARQVIPSRYYQKRLAKKLSDSLDSNAVDRIEYYNRLNEQVLLDTKAQTLSSLSRKDSISVYYFDLFEYSRYFKSSLKGHFLFGDITEIPEYPSFVKSRPIQGDNTNAVILKWNKIRHFTFVKNDPNSFLDKKDELVFRGNIHDCQPHRIDFMEKHFTNPLCNIGKVNRNNLNYQWTVSKMSINEQLDYKFILCLEGADVASNLKWVMSSRSLAVMPRPKYETWFMEGTLQPNVHYVEIKDDYSDLDERIEYYIKHTEEASRIINNANRYVDQFKNRNREDLISLHVLKKYFEMTGQEL